MSKSLYKSTLAFTLCALTTLALADTAPSTTTAPKTKTYQLLKLRETVSNNADCKAAYHSLKQLKKNPLSFQFTANNGPNNFKLSDQAAKVQNHTYTQLNQSINGNMINRVGMGNFMLDQRLIQYVIVISGDAAQKDFQYLYPVILSSDNAHCYFTAVLKPDSKTRDSFKKNIVSGDVSTQKDLAN